MSGLSSILAPITSQITAATTTPASTSTTSTATTTTGSSSPSLGGAVDNNTIAGNFTTFLTLLTTQLKNQNPLDPLDTNQFTAQLVQFAQVEQQMKQNDQLATLVSIEKAAQSTTALAFVGTTVAVDGQTAALTNGRATWGFNVPKPASTTLTIKSSTGQTVYSTSFTMNAGPQSFTWDGRDNNGVKWPNGNYTISVVGRDASGQPVSISSEVQGTVDSVDLTQTPPVLSIGGQTFTLDKIKRVVRPSSA
jgi:flagellar basal-body rod modification protein FlgD